jgi:hypothetical protein
MEKTGNYIENFVVDPLEICQDRKDNVKINLGRYVQRIGPKVSSVAAFATVANFQAHSPQC